jgi:hypothetical protein
MISVWHEEGEETPSPEVMQQMFKDVDAFNRKCMDAGIWVFGGGLEMPDTATVVDGTGDDVTTTDGPFSEAKEQIGGFWVLEAPDLDAALKLAAEGSKACRGRVEVRPFQAEDVQPEDISG